MAETKPKAKAKSTSGRISFPQKVYNVLKLTEENHQENIISWVNNGTAFRVHDLDEFKRDLLPKHFNTHKYASFTRTLCAYGFNCVRTGRQTGIYSHPKFNRNNAAALSLIKRVKNNKNTAKEAISQSNSPNLNYAIREGNQTILFPSLLNNPISNETGNASAFNPIFQALRAQLADRTTKMLVRLPPGSQLISPFASDDEGSMGRSSPPVNPFPLLSSATANSSSFTMSASPNLTTIPNHQQQNCPNKQIVQNYGTMQGDNATLMPPAPPGESASEQTRKPQQVPQTLDMQNQFQQVESLEPVPFSPQHDVFQDDEVDLEPIPWSPQHTTTTSQDNSASHRSNEEEVLMSSLEPRSIKNMREHPDTFNGWYNAMPVVPKPKYQALYDLSSPVAIPGLFYYLDISTFGLCWATFLIVGHTTQALFTYFGPDTEHLVLSPKIGILKHHFMDIMWVHTLLSAMVLVPDYFGASSVLLAIVFFASQAPNMAINLKTHYSNSGKKGEPYIHGEWWVADIVRWIFLGYTIAILSVCLGYYYGIGLLVPIGVFLMNLTPLFACQSYRLLLSIPSTGMVHQDSDKKYN